MKEYERNHRDHRGKNKNSLCSPSEDDTGDELQREFPLKDVTERIISLGKRVGLLVNFNVSRLKEGIKKLVL